MCGNECKLMLIARKMFFLKHQGSGTCPFGNKCFYRHCLADGKKVDVGEPQRPARALNSLGHLENLPVSNPNSVHLSETMTFQITVSYRIIAEYSLLEFLRRKDVLGRHCNLGFRVEYLRLFGFLLTTLIDVIMKQRW